MKGQIRQVGTNLTMKNRRLWYKVSVPVRKVKCPETGMATGDSEKDLCIKKTPMKKTLLAIPMLFFLMGQAFAQTVSYNIEGNEVDNMRNLQIRVYPEFFIAPGDQEITLPTNLIADARYWMGSLLDLRAGISLGTNKGLNLGGCLHLIDRVHSRNEKFVVSRSTSGRTVTQRYFKAPVQVRSMSGPSADLFVGTQFGRFTTKLDLGWEWQGFRRSYASYDGRSIAGSNNGYHSIKIQAVFQGPIPTESWSFNEEGLYVPKRSNEMGIGAQMAFDYHFRPWKRLTMYGGVTGGYIKVPNDGSAPIIAVRFGACLSNSLKLF